MLLALNHVQQQSGGTNWTAISVIIAGSAFVATLAGIFVTRAFRVKDSLGWLVDRYDDASFQVLMWRMEQLTRTNNEELSTDPITRAEIKAWIEATHPSDKAERLRVLAQGLGSDWSEPVAHMHAVHYFAQRVQAWRHPSLFRWTPFVSKRRRTRMLNQTFGRQLVATFLDHWFAAVRLRRPDKDDAYFVRQYGVLTSGYEELVHALANELVNPKPRAWWLTITRRANKAPTGGMTKSIEARWDAVSAAQNKLKGTS